MVSSVFLLIEKRLTKYFKNRDCNNINNKVSDYACTHMTKSRAPLTMEPLVCKNIVQLKFCCRTLDTQNLSHISDYDNKPKTLILYFVSKRIPITDTLFQTPLVSMMLLENPTLPVQQHISIKAIIYGAPVPLPFPQCPHPPSPVVYFPGVAFCHQTQWSFWCSG